MRIIDAHNHPDWHGYNLEKFLANMAQHGIEKTWLFSWECPLDEFDPTYNNVFLIGSQGFPIPFSRCLDYKQRAPDRFVLGYAPDPRRPDAIDQLEAAVGPLVMRGAMCGTLYFREAQRPNSSLGLSPCPPESLFAERWSWLLVQAATASSVSHQEIVTMFSGLRTSWAIMSFSNPG